MTWRWDKFNVGDKVTWADDDYATMTRGRATYGDGPFAITNVEDIRYSSREVPYDLQGVENASRWSAMGHTQIVTIATAVDHHVTRYSGAFFRVVK